MNFTGPSHEIRDDDFIYDEEKAMNEMFRYITEETSIESILEESKYLVVFPFDPTSITKEDITDLEKYFAERDEFEKCIILRDYKK